MAKVLTEGSAYYPLMDDRALQYECEVRCYSRLLMSERICSVLEMHRIPISASLTRARDVLGISITALSEILAVSRPTLYSFLSGKEPSVNEEAIAAKVHLIDSLSQMVSDSGLPVPSPSLLKRRDFSGRTAKDLLKDGSLKKSDISTFIAIERHYQAKSEIRLAAKGTKA